MCSFSRGLVGRRVCSPVLSVVRLRNSCGVKHAKVRLSLRAARPGYARTDERREIKRGACVVASALARCNRGRSVAPVQAPGAAPLARGDEGAPTGPPPRQRQAGLPKEPRAPRGGSRSPAAERVGRSRGRLPSSRPPCRRRGAPDGVTHLGRLGPSPSDGPGVGRSSLLSSARARVSNTAGMARCCDRLLRRLTPPSTCSGRVVVERGNVGSISRTQIDRCAVAVVPTWRSGRAKAVRVRVTPAFENSSSFAANLRSLWIRIRQAEGGISATFSAVIGVELPLSV